MGRGYSVDMSRKEDAKGDDVALDTRAPKDEVEEGEGRKSRSDTVFQAKFFLKTPIFFSKKSTKRHETYKKENTGAMLQTAD